jgi:hypothetical protein
MRVKLDLLQCAGAEEEVIGFTVCNVNQMHKWSDQGRCDGCGM